MIRPSLSYSQGEGTPIPSHSARQTEYILKALECGIIGLDDLALQKEAILKKILENRHPYQISQASDGRWVTYILDATKPRGTRQIRRKSKTALYEFLIDHYGITPGKNSVPTFGEVFLEWIEYKRAFTTASYKPLSPSTIRRYERDYRKLIENTPFSDTSVTMNDLQLERYIIQAVQGHAMRPRDFGNFYGYLSQIFPFAVRRRYISSDPMIYLDKKKLMSFCTAPTVKTDAERVLSRSELGALLISIRRHLRELPGYAPDYAIELAILTGMRVGEIVALRWDHIDRDYIHVDLAERRFDYTDRSEIIIGEPKCGKHRTIPITEDMRGLLDMIPQISIEWVFATDQGRITARAVSAALRRRCREAGIDPTSIHEIRRTVSSMLNAVLPREAVAAMLGHLPTTNERFYDYDTTEKAQKIAALEEVSSKVINFSSALESKKIAEAQ